MKCEICGREFDRKDLIRKVFVPYTIMCKECYLKEVGKSSGLSRETLEWVWNNQLETVE